jgi:hypothetical protein
MKAIVIIILFTLANVAIFAGIVVVLNSRANDGLKIAPSRKRSLELNHRIAVLIPFVGDGPESIPPYLNLFVTAAAGSSSLVDFFIFHNGVLDYFYYDDLPPNVKIVSFGSIEGMMKQFLRVVDQRQEEEFALQSRDFLVQVLSKHLIHYPYVLVEFKPALGHIFASYLSGYTHWAYSDLDIAFGDLASWVTTEELEQFDLVTYGFGDADRIYLRGQFTMHRNDPSKINQLWRDCDYLSKMDERFADILTGASKLHFESAEACYSVKVLKRDDVKVKFSVKAFTDVHKEDSAYTHGMYLGMGIARDNSALYKADSGQGHALIDLDRVWFEQPSNVELRLQEEHGAKGVVQWRNDPSVNCMYWVREIYRSELCIQGADSTDTIFLENGRLLKQTYQNINIPSGISSAPFFHFQEWKRFFRYNQNAAIDRKSTATWILTKEGALPLPSRGNNYSEDVRTPLGIPPSKWKGTRDQLPPHPYCIITGLRNFPPVPPAPGCEMMISWRNRERVEVLSEAPSWKRVNPLFDVTLALTLQITAGQATRNLDAILDVAIANVEAWQRQPCVLIVHVAGATVSIADRVRHSLQSIIHDGCLIALVAQERSDFVSRKALINMAVDAAPTRWVVSGIELERGLIVSSEASTFCRRRAKIHEHHRGQVLILPQFAVTNVEGNRAVSVLDLLSWKAASPLAVRHPADFEKRSCENDYAGSNSLFAESDEMWWRFTTLEVRGVSLAEKYDLTNRLAKVFDELETSLVDMFIAPEDIAGLDNSPTLMIDNMGPYSGVWTSTFTREVEEFGGKYCHNAMRLAQLATLGYDFYVLVGAFVSSTQSSRGATLARTNDDAIGASRCDGCIMLQGKHEDMMQRILDEERTRVAKAAVLWSEL